MEGDIFVLVGILVFFGAIIGLSLYWTTTKLREQKRQEEQAFQNFQSEFEQEFPHSTNRITREKFHLDPSKAVSMPEQLMDYLKKAGLFESSEGPYFPLDPSGSCILVRLSRKKTALIVPRFESEHFILQAVKRFDLVFLILSGGEVLVLSKYSDFIAGHYEMR